MPDVDVADGLLEVLDIDVDVFRTSRGVDSVVVVESAAVELVEAVDEVVNVDTVDSVEVAAARPVREGDVSNNKSSGLVKDVVAEALRCV